MMSKIELKYCSENTYCLIPTIKTFRNNFSKTEGIEFMGDNYFVGLKWFNQVVGLNLKFKPKQR
jgi:hypothetical protein